MKHLTKFTVHDHYRRSQHRNHWDLRILSPRRNVAWSWALPKARFPEPHERLLVIRTVDHNTNIMTFHGKVEDSGDTIEIVDTGDCELLSDKQTHMTVLFKGKKINGIYNLIEISKNSWLMIGSKNVETKR